MDQFCQKSLVKYTCQMIILVCVICACIVNLTRNHVLKDVWLTLLSSSLGYILPNPSVKRRNELKD